MDTNNHPNQVAVPVNTTGKEQVVFALPAKPAPKPPFWERYFGELVLIWACVLLALWIWVNP